jgi:hypothetical protein
MDSSSSLGDGTGTSDADRPKNYNFPLQREPWTDMTAMSIRLQALVEESGIARETHQEIVNMMNSMVDKLDRRKSHSCRQR